jgi:hypothetical protein
MRIQNKSSIETNKFYPILDFITQYGHGYTSLATLYIEETEADFTHGMCHRIAPELDDINLAAPSLIELWVRKNPIYPVVTTHVMGDVKIYNWEEEVLLVLSHEIAHLNQYYGWPVSYSTDENQEAEEAAEKSAIVLLDSWRKERT